MSTTTVARADALADALQLIDSTGCEVIYQGRCWQDPTRTRGARYTANAWCHPCIAAHALAQLPDSTSRTAAHTPTHGQPPATVLAGA